jgi:ring-1,2-phenylacetyl-CoA epoxidase subunit PaaE
MMGRFHRLQVQGIRQETRDAVVVTFGVPAHLKEEFRYTQGQHLTLRADIDGADERRSYSICSAVQDDELRVAVKKVQGGIFSTWINERVRPGQAIDVMPPLGHFHTSLVKDNRKHYLAFAAGSGITPVLSIIKTTLLAEPHSHFTLFYGNRASSTVLFREELADVKDTYLTRFNLVHVLSREQQDIDLFNGRITGSKCEQLLDHWVDLADIDMVFICGPEGMMHEVSETLQARGMDKSQIKIELFAASVPKKAQVHSVQAVVGQQECTVTVIMDGRSRTFALEKNKEPILDAALKQGIELPYSCKAGVCSTCRAKLTEGEVDMDVNFALEDYEVARGFVLCCQSYPVTDTVVLDFDQGG